MRKLCAAAVCLALICGCFKDEGPVRIGSKSFAENRVLAEMFAALAREEGVPVKTYIPYGNAFDVHKGIIEDDLDLYPEYTGTALGMIGDSAPADEIEAMKRARERYDEIGITWLPGPGFNNSYVLVMQRDEAARLEVENVGDLTGLERPVRLGCTEEFLARPVDGYRPLIRRYGFSPEPDVSTVRERERLFGMLVTGEVEVIVAQGTDPQIEEFNLMVIEDNLEFFPAYECAPIVKDRVLARYPALEPALSKLAGKIDNAAMRSLNRKVDLDGMEAKAVATAFLVEQGLLDKEPAEERREELVVALPPDEARSKTVTRALKAIREAFPNRRVVLEDDTESGRALMTGEAIIAILGAEHFFDIDPGKLPRAREDIEAIAPAGFHAVHIIRPRRSVSSYCFSRVRKLGVGPRGGSGEKIARFLIDGYDETGDVKVVTGSFEDQLEAVYRGRLSALLVMDDVGQARIILALGDKPALALQPISDWRGRGREFRYPFLRQTRIPKDTYPGMREAVDTLGAQVVLAGPRPEERMLGDGDPVSGIRTQREAIPRGYKEALVKALDAKEAIDPTLPGERVSMVTARKEIMPVNPDPGVSLLTAVLMLVVGALLYYTLVRAK